MASAVLAWVGREGAAHDLLLIQASLLLADPSDRLLLPLGRARRARHRDAGDCKLRDDVLERRRGDDPRGDDLRGTHDRGGRPTLEVGRIDRLSELAELFFAAVLEALLGLAKRFIDQQLERDAVGERRIWVSWLVDYNRSHRHRLSMYALALAFFAFF